MIDWTAFEINPRFPEPSEEVQRKIYLSFKEAEEKGSREMKCPVCGFKVTDVPLTQTEVVYVRCRRCKFQGALSPAYFRRRRKRYAGDMDDFRGLSNCGKR